MAVASFNRVNRLRRSSSSRGCVRRGRQRAVLPRAEAYIDCLLLTQYEKQPFVAENGWIAPKRDLSAQGFVFAVFDEEDVLQFIGFSKDIRNSLRNVFYRRPQQCQYYRHVDLATLDQKLMGSIRDTWLQQENGKVPPGLGKDKELWLKPPRGGQEDWEAILASLQARGLKEVFEVDEAKLAEGSIELLPSSVDLTPQEEAEKEEHENYVKNNTYQVKKEVDGKIVEFEMFISLDFKTNGGYMMDVDVTQKPGSNSGDASSNTSTHRISISDPYLAKVKIPRAELLQRTFAFLIPKVRMMNTDRNAPTDIKDFPINYFSMNQVQQLFKGFDAMIPEGQLPDQDDLWGFKRHGHKGFTVGPEAGEEIRPRKGLPLVGPEFGFQDGTRVEQVRESLRKQREEMEAEKQAKLAAGGEVEEEDINDDQEDIFDQILIPEIDIEVSVRNSKVKQDSASDKKVETK